MRVSRSAALFGITTAIFVWQASRAIGAQTAQSKDAAGSVVAATPGSPAAGASSQADADGIIFERQQAMLQLEKDADVMGSIVSGEVPPGKLAATARAIAQDAKDSYQAFKPNVPGGRSRPEVWADWADYSARMEKFVRSTEAMSKVAQTGDVATVTSMLGEALPCKECHDVYRLPKKP